MLYGSDNPISGQSDFRESAPNQEKTSLPGTFASVSKFVCVAALDPEGPISVPSSEILIRFPFDG